MSRPRETVNLAPGPAGKTRAPRPAAEDWRCQTCRRFPALPGLPVCSQCRAREPREEAREIPTLAALRGAGAPGLPWSIPRIPGAEYIHPSLLAEPARQAPELDDEDQGEDS